MNPSLRLLPVVFGAGLSLVGCSGSPPPAQPPPQAAASAPIKTPFDTLLKDKAKAKAVQQTVNDYAKRQQAALKKAGG